MNDAMNIRKVFSPISPTQRVHRLKKEHSHSKKRDFERDLGEEKERDKHEKQGGRVPETAIINDEERTQRDFNEKPSDSGVDVKKCNRRGTVGVKVDIRV